MNKCYLLLSLFFFVAFSSNAQFKPVSVTGFNADIIANGVGDASTSTNAGADAGGYAFVSGDFLAVAGGTPPTYYLPADGWIYSTSTAGLSFKLADYSANNVSRLSTSTSTTETLTFDTAQPAVEVDLLAYSGSGTSTTDITLNFTDGTQQTATGITVADWYNGTPFVIQGIGRVNITTNAFSGDASNPRLYALKILVDPANFTKDISNITIAKTNTTTSVLGVLAVSVLKFNPAYMPMTLTGFNADVVADGINDPTMSTTNDVDGATPPYAFVAPDYQHDGTCALPARHLPEGGVISSNALPGMRYQLEAYTANNDLRLTTTDVGTLTFGTPTPSKAVYLLAVGGGGAAKISATVTFSDNTTQFFDSLSISDWYGGTTNIVTQGIGRVRKNTTDCTGLETSTTSPKLFQILLTLDTANQSKAVQSVTISRIDGITGFAGIANIMAISVELTNMVLPVTMTELKGHTSPTGNVLDWTTKTEINNAGFEVQRSADGRVFSAIDLVRTKAENGNSSKDISYSYVDTKVRGTNNYYRLKQTDKDGRVTFSNIAFVKGTSLQVASVYPNPAANKLNMVVTSPVDSKIHLVVSDLAGRILINNVREVIAGENELSVNVNGLAPDTYLLKVISIKGDKRVIKFIKE